MHELYNLKDMLTKELEEYGSKGELSGGSLEVVDKLAHAIKNLDKIIECDDEEYSRGYDMRHGSYARRSAGRYSRRYSRDGGMVEELREMMDNAPDDRTRAELEKFIRKMENY